MSPELKSLLESSIFQLILFIFAFPLTCLTFTKITIIKNPLNNLSYCKISIQILYLVALSMFIYIGFHTVDITTKYKKIKCNSESDHSNLCTTIERIHHVNNNIGQLIPMMAELIVIT